MADDADAPQKIMYVCEDDGKTLYGWAIQHEGKHWLVPHWDIGTSDDTLSRMTKAIFLCLAVMLLGTSANAQTCRVQCILDCADDLAKKVKEYEKSGKVYDREQAKSAYQSAWTDVRAETAHT